MNARQLKTKIDNILQDVESLKDLQKLVDTAAKLEESIQANEQRAKGAEERKNKAEEDMAAMQVRLENLEESISAAREKAKVDAEQRAEASKAAFIKQEEEQQAKLTAMQQEFDDQAALRQQEIDSLDERIKEATSTLHSLQNSINQIKKAVGS